MAFIFSFLLMTSPDTVTITSEAWDELHYETTGRWVPFSDGWVIFTTDYTRNAIALWAWRDGKDIELLLRSGPREGLTIVSAAAMIPGTDTIALRCGLTGRIFSVALDTPKPRFVRTHHAGDLAGDMLFWDRDTLIGGAHPSLKPEQYGDGRALSFLGRVQRLLPDDVDHPSSRHLSAHQLKMSRSGDRLLIGWVLHPKFLVFDIGEEVRKVTREIRFPGYVEPPDNYPEGEDFRRYFENFHHLRELVWHGERPFARFKKGFNSFGIWIDLEEPEKQVWDNDAETEKVFAVGVDEVVMATVTEDTEGLVTCTLWRRPSFPSLITPGNPSVPIPTKKEF